MALNQFMLNALKGNMGQGVPFAPRLDIWYYSNLYNGTLPKEFAGLDLKQIVFKLGCVYNKYLPDYADQYSLQAVEQRLLGFYNSRDVPYRIHLDKSIQTRLTNNHGLVEITYITPAGELNGSFVMDDHLKEQGSTLPPIQEHLVKSADHYHLLIELLSAVKVTPAPENYRRLSTEIGPQGCPAIFGHLAASPMQAVLRDFLDPTLFFIEYKTNLAGLLEVAKSLERILLEIAQIACSCSPEPIVLWGGNYDSMLTFPPFFKAHILPFLNTVGELVHAKHGRLISHCDGDNRLLLSLLKESGIDILQSVNVSPMVTNTYREIRDSLRPDQVISGGIPALVLMPSATSDAEFPIIP